MPERGLDGEILLQLLKDSRMSALEIAKRVGTTRQTAAKKIKQLKGIGVIDSFTLRLNSERIGLNTKAYVFLQEDPSSELRRKNEKAIKQVQNVFAFHRLFGRYSAILEILVKDNDELKKLVRKIHKLKGIRETETFIVHSTVKEAPEEPFVKALKSR